MMTSLLLVVFIATALFDEGTSLSIGAQVRIGGGSQISLLARLRLLGLLGRNQDRMPDTEYMNCGSTTCLNSPGVQCDEAHDKCTCPPSWTGDPRVQCCDPDMFCLCTIMGDPHMTTFRRQAFNLPLPCSHVIADLTTPSTSSLPKGCKVKVVGRAWYPGKWGPVDAALSYENQIDVVVESDTSRFTTRIGIKGVTKTNTTRINVGQSSGRSSSSSSSGSHEDVANIDVQTDFDDAGFNTVFIGECQISIKYRGKDGSFALVTQVGSDEKAGLCGECDKHFDRALVNQNPNAEDVLTAFLAALQSSSPIDSSDVNIYPSCTALTKTVNTCHGVRKTLAFGFCGEMVTNSVLRLCMSARLGKDKVQDQFAMCYEAVCSGKKKCSVFEAIYTGCPSSHVNRYLHMPVFCKP